MAELGSAALGSTYLGTISISESGSVSVTATPKVSESGTAEEVVDSVSITTTVSGTDATAGSESGSVSVTTTVNATDSAPAADSGSVDFSATPSVTDTGVAAETPRVGATATVDASETIFATRSPSSYSSAITSNADAVISLYVDPESHSATITNTGGRQGVNYAPRSTSSYGIAITSFTFNQVTSLELINMDLTWNPGDASWYSDWYQEERITGSEDTFAIRAMITPDAKRPAALIFVQYDADGNGIIDDVSDPIHLDTDGEIKYVTGVPLDEEGHYRLRITDYSGYNSLYQLDTGMVH